MRFNLADILSKTSFMDSCQVWTKAKSKAGYGQIWDGQKVVYVHRVVASLVYGQPEFGQEVLHLCDNRACCNPNHLRWGSRKDNMVDASTKGRLKGKRVATGMANSNSKLDFAQIQELRKQRKSGAKLRELAEAYQISIAATSKIVRGEVRKHG